MSKHTKGPWRVDMPYLEIQGATGKHVATIRVLPFATEEESAANARLIAAAPDLLEVCKAVVELDGFVGSALMRKRIEEMKAAISKAEGTHE